MQEACLTASKEIFSEKYHNSGGEQLQTQASSNLSCTIIFVVAVNFGARYEEGLYTMYVPALRLPPVGLLVEEKAKEDPPVPTPPNPGPPPKPVGESDMEVSLD